jgi:hypothetical protein
VNNTAKDTIEVLGLAVTTARKISSSLLLILSLSAPEILRLEQDK